MKRLTLRAGLALLCASTLAACGGGSGSLVLQATVYGLTKDGLILVNGSDTFTVQASNGGTFTVQFNKLVNADDTFDIEIQHQPTHATCTLKNNKQKANVYTVSQTQVNCITDSYAFGGTVTGLTGTGLVLINGADQVAVLPATTPGAPVSFQFPTQVADGAAFGVTVLAQPAGQVCTVANNTGNMPSGAYNNLAVTCK
jgi:hypothetical protein